MSQIRRLSKEVKDEVHDIKRIKGEVTHMKVRLESPFQTIVQNFTGFTGGDHRHQAPRGGHHACGYAPDDQDEQGDEDGGEAAEEPDKEPEEGGDGSQGGLKQAT